MSYPNAIEVCRAELFTKEVELRERYPGQMVEKVLRVREMYNWFIANPDGTTLSIPSTLAARNSRSTILSRCLRAELLNSALNYMTIT